MKMLPTTRNFATISTLRDKDISKTGDSTLYSTKHKNSFTIQVNDDNIEVVYDNDLNILELHSVIRDFTTKTVENDMNKLKKEKAMIKEKTKKPITALKALELHDRLQYIKKELLDLSQYTKLKEYYESVKLYLDEYNKIGTKDEEEDDPEIEEENDRRRKILIELYILETGKYFNLIINKVKEQVMKCRNCRKEIDVIENKVMGMYICECGWSCPVLTKTRFSDDIIFNNGKGEEESKQNFIKCIKRYQGKQINKLPKDICERLDEYFVNKGMPSGEEIRSRPLEERKTNKISLKLLLNGLKQAGLSTFYKDCNLIGHIYWGWELYDISHLEAQILEDYSLVRPIIQRLCNKSDRKSNLNLEVSLYQHLNKVGHHCTSRDFKLIETTETIAFYNRIFREAWKEMGWGEPKTID